MVELLSRVVYDGSLPVVLLLAEKRFLLRQTFDIGLATDMGAFSVCLWGGDAVRAFLIDLFFSLLML